MSIYSKDAAINNGDLTQTEIHLYGNSRLGIYNLKNNVERPDLNTGGIINFTTGNKFSELGNHLGNVLATVSDKKLQHSSDNVRVDYFTADVVSAQDYYPFGMMMPLRKYSVANTNYRYGFNGKENDNNVKGEGNQQDYGMRIYDPRLGRFLSVDPITKEYPELTPYQFASSTPMQTTDLDGLEKYVVHYKIENGLNIILKVVTDNSLKYLGGPTVWGQPTLHPKVVQYIQEDRNGKVLNTTGEIPLKNF